MRTFYKNFIIPVIFFWCFPFFANAQGSFFLAPASGTYRVGDSFSVLVNLNSGNEAVNAGVGQINFDNSKLQVISLGYSQSIFSLWTENPSYSNPGGTIKFSGGVPSPGFTGDSGAILRITFVAKDTGQASVNFLNGTILANDGEGTNIVNRLVGASFTILPVETKTAEPSEKTPPKKVETAPAQVPSSAPVVGAQKPMSAPVLTKWPRQLNNGDTLTIEGLGYPLTKITIILQRDTEKPINEYTFAGFDGKFRFTYSGRVDTGFYTIWARNTDANGNESGLSDPVVVEVVAPTFLMIGSMMFSYDTIILVLFSLILSFVLVLLFLWFFYSKKEKKREREISEAEKVLHESFDILKEGLCQYMDYIVSAHNSNERKKRVTTTKTEIRDELDKIEKNVDKEIEDTR